VTAGRPPAAVRIWILAVAFALLLAGTAQAVPRSFFGVVPQAPLTADDFTRMGSAHVGLLRVQLSWTTTDPGPATGDEDWSAFDAVVGGGAREGVRTLPFVFGTPSWVLALDGRTCRHERCPPYPPKGERALAAWRDFLAAAVDRYGPEGSFWSKHPELPALPIRAWQIWNEQNSPTFFAPKPSVRSYARLLTDAHEAIAGRDPGAKVILGGMFGKPLGGRHPVIAASEYLADLYRRPGLAAAFDGVAAHPYGAGLDAVREQVGALRERIRRSSDDAKIWVTEVGWASGGPPGPLNRGPQGQAKRLRKTFRYLLAERRRLRIATVDWYSWRDAPSATPGLCAWCAQSGLLSADGVPKPAFGAFTQMAGGDGGGDS
jgi:polysaccharide biosynthesis protein PslG